MAKRVSFNVVCPFCGNGTEQDETVKIDLNNMLLHCTACDEEFTVAQAVSKAREALARWEAVQRWVEMAPAAMRGDDDAAAVGIAATA